MSNETLSASADIVDRAAGLDVGSATYAVRQVRGKVVAATQGSFETIFDPSLNTSLPLEERLLLALYACQLSAQQALADFYLARLQQAQLPESWLGALNPVLPEAFASVRLQGMLEFTRRLTVNPVEGDREALAALQASGLDTPSVVVIAQLLAFIAYQVRLTSGLSALSTAHVGVEAVPDVPVQQEPGAVGSEPLDIQGFTNRTLGWTSWLTTLDLTQADSEQLAVLEESHPQAKTSDYYLTLIHQPQILRQRSAAFNAIMYAPGGLSRAERELASTVVSRINQCVYCASVHAQRFEQLAKRNDVIAQVFADPQTAGTTEREKAIVRFAIDLTQEPASLGAEHIRPLREQGLDDGQVLDLIHAISIFAWANRLMLNLGEPVYTPV
ncbi:hypothetical protein PSCICN_06510 [Pseudomonas cichorii]|nr:hypothetical protein PSCICN_06510 [Pseudomonas cichorii]